jgi:hypothetical protein
MAAETFEYAIKKDVRNNPIVREIDRDHRRGMWRSVGVGTVLVSTILFWAWQSGPRRPRSIAICSLRSRH